MPTAGTAADEEDQAAIQRLTSRLRRCQKPDSQNASRAGRHQIGLMGEIISESWARSNRYTRARSSESAINAIAADDYRYFTRGVLVPGNGEPYHPGSEAPGDRERYFLDECQLIWVLGSPQDRVARDVWQMLWLASKHTAFVNSIEGLVFLNTKHALGYSLPKQNRAYSYISDDFSLLWERYRETPDQWWVADKRQLRAKRLLTSSKRTKCSNNTSMPYRQYCCTRRDLLWRSGWL